MNSRTFATCAIAASSFALPAPSFALCEAQSGPNTAALVELYTSEGCSSCPPADQLLGQLRRSLGPATEVIPLALHVNYWDHIGWKDPYAQGAFGERQKWLVHANNQRTIYTPQFFVGGAELRSRRETLQSEVQRLNTTPAGASIRVQAAVSASGALTLTAEARARGGVDPLALYLAVTESGLVSKVTRGENGGATLRHDHVVRAWFGPSRLTGETARLRRELALPRAWQRGRLEVVAFVQNEHTGRVLQAVSARKCTDS